jgi:haloacetate dehalogenase
MFHGFESKLLKTSGAEISMSIGGEGLPLLLLHGYPQTRAMWHKIAPGLSQHFKLVIPDLRGYGDSSKPPGGENHINYSKREMARDQIEVMEQLGYREFYVAGHDRGGRVGHRMALDYPDRVKKLAVLDIIPTYKVFATVDKELATAYHHWFFLIQPYDFPERLIGANPKYYLMTKLAQWSRISNTFDPEALEEYVRCFQERATIHATCEDYRAAASIDLEHDRADLERKITCPLLVLWGNLGFVGRKYDVLETWRERADMVQGEGIESGHFLPEEAPESTLKLLLEFL